MWKVCSILAILGNNVFFDELPYVYFGQVYLKVRTLNRLRGHNPRGKPRRWTSSSAAVRARNRSAVPDCSTSHGLEPPNTKPESLAMKKETARSLTPGLRLLPHV